MITRRRTVFASKYLCTVRKLVPTGIQAENLYGRERAEFSDAEAHYVRDRSDGNRYGGVGQRSRQSFGHVHGDGGSSPRG